MNKICYPPGLLGVDEVIARLLTVAAERKPAVEIAPLKELLGRVLAEDIHAGVPVPPRPNSAMDGIAFSYADANAKGTTTLYISQRLPAGTVPRPLLPGSVARIFTGAELPTGADSILMQEECSFDGDRVTFTRPPRPGQNIRPAGQDIAKGSFLLGTGQRLGPAHLGLMAAVGEGDVAVYKRLTVALLSTGDELADPGQPLPPGKIYNSNRYTVMALLQQLGVEVLDLGMVPDKLEATKAALQKAVKGGADVIVSTGGVSVGDEDHVKPAVEALGHIDLWRVAIKPGKPLAFGNVSGIPFIGLPGNPQSVWVTFLLVARPFLLRAQGQLAVMPMHIPVASGFAMTKAQDRREYLRVRLVSGLQGMSLEKHENQSSGVLSSAVWADGLALVEAGTTVSIGQNLPYLPFSSLLAS
jgi:molybdopterin molybdotransferase